MRTIKAGYSKQCCIEDKQHPFPPCFQFGTERTGSTHLVVADFAMGLSHGHQHTKQTETNKHNFSPQPTKKLFGVMLGCCTAEGCAVVSLNIQTFKAWQPQEGCSRSNQPNILHHWMDPETMNSRPPTNSGTQACIQLGNFIQSDILHT